MFNGNFAASGEISKFVDMLVPELNKYKEIYVSVQAGDDFAHYTLIFIQGISAMVQGVSYTIASNSYAACAAVRVNFSNNYVSLCCRQVGGGWDQSGICINKIVGKNPK